MEDSSILLAKNTIFCKISWAAVSHALWIAFFSAHSLPNRDVNDEMATRNSFSIINGDRYFVFMIVIAENPGMHKYIVTKESRTFTALSSKLG
jgi:hypothetical protein